MKKRLLSFLMATVMLLSLTAGVVPVVKADEALPSYNLCDDFGNEVFSYGTRNLSNGEMTIMSWNETQKMYQSGSNYINSGFLSTGTDTAVCSVVTFTAPYTGKITVASQTVLDAGYEVNGIVNRGKLWSSDYSVCYAQVYKNSFANQLANYSLPANNTPVVVDDIVDIEVTAGDRIMFMVGSNTAKNSYIEWLPDITYTKIAHEHTWAETMSSDADYHWYDCTAEDCDIADNASKEGYGAHIDEDINGACDACGYAMPIVLAKYNLFNDFGNEVFGYSTRNVSNGTMTAMSYNETQKMYQSGSNYINAGFLSAGDDPAVCSVVTFTAPYTGKITITADSVVAGITNRGKLWSSDYAECYAQIFYNSFANGIVGYNLPANNTTQVVDDVTMNVTAGDRIMFMVGSNTAKNSYIEWLPEIVYTEMAHVHAWAETMSSDEDYHWYDCTAEDCDIADNASKEGYGAHIDEDINGACDACGYAMPIALARYNLFNDFGHEVFSYSIRNVSNGTMSTMSWNETQKMYQNGSNFVNAGFLSVGNDPAVCSVVTFTAPYTGKITITADSVVAGITNRGKLWSSDYAECYAQIFYNSFANGIVGYNLPANNTTQVVDDVTMNVTAGDRIMFMVGSNTAKNSYIEWLPEIVYTEIAHIHTWDEAWTSDATHHWHMCGNTDCDIMDAAEMEGYAEHIDIDVNMVCDVCGTACTLSYTALDIGADVFTYWRRNVSNGLTEQMSWNETQQMFALGANYINAGFLSTGTDAALCSVLTFTAPYTGTITITSDPCVNGITNRGKQWSGNYAECYAQILYPNWATTEVRYNLPANNTTIETSTITLNVKRGEQIRFMVGSNSAMNSYIEWIPMITYTEVIHAHEWETEWTADATAHWHECYDGCSAAENADKKGYGNHIDDNGDLVCDICAYADADVVFEAREAVTYYVSSSTGSDDNDGLTAATAWKTMDKVSQTRLLAGDTVLFKSGDIWYGSWELDLSHGTERDPITFGSYGEGDKPDFRYYNGTVEEKAAGICLFLKNANGFVMNGLSVGYANLGIKLIYEEAYYESEYVRFENCHFHDIYGVTQLDNVNGIYFSAGISTGLENSAFTSDAEGNGWPLRGLYIDGCTTNDAGSLVAGPTGVYGFYMTDCIVENNGYYGTTVYGCRNGYIDGCIFRNNGTRSMSAGSCGIMMSVQDFTVKNTVIIGHKRQGSDPDGCGIDFEANCQNVTIENCLFQENAGVGVFYFTSGTGEMGTNYNTNILNCYFINNNQNPDGDIPEYDVFTTYYGTSGCTVSGNKYYYRLIDGSKTDGFAEAWDNNDWTVTNNIKLNAIPENLQEIVLNGSKGAEVEEYNVSLRENINLNFYLDIMDCYKSDAVVTVAVASEQIASYTADQIVNEEGKYVVSVELAAAQMTEDVTVRIVAGNLEFVNKTYSVRQYADYILDEANCYTEQDKLMVRAMLQYGASAQEYFGVNNDAYANDGYEDVVTETIPDATDFEAIVSGSVDGIRFYGASLLFRNKITVRLYFSISGNGSYTVNGEELKQKDGLWYYDISNIGPHDLDDVIEVAVADEGGDTFTISYSPIHYIARMYQKTENAALKMLVQNLYDYHKAAESYANAA